MDGANQPQSTPTKSKKAWYKRVWVWVIVVIVLIGIGAAASSVKTVNTNPTNSKSNNNSSSNTAPSGSTSTAKKPSTAKVGDTLSLKDESNNPMDITLVKVVDPANGADQYTTPDAGKRFVGVQFKIVNTGSQALSEDADNDATLFDSTSQSYDTSIDSLDGCQAFATSSSLAPGESELGCVTFEIPTGATVAKVQFTPSSGFSNSTGEWLVP